MKFFRNAFRETESSHIYNLKYPLLILFYFGGKHLIYNRHKVELQNTLALLKSDALAKAELNYRILNANENHTVKNTKVVENVIKIFLDQTKEIQEEIDKIISSPEDKASFWKSFEKLKNGEVNITLTKDSDTKTVLLNKFEILENDFKIIKENPDFLLFALAIRYFNFLRKEAQINRIQLNLKNYIDNNSQVKLLNSVLSVFDTTDLQPVQKLYFSPGFKNEKDHHYEELSINSKLSSYLLLNILEEERFTTLVNNVLGNNKIHQRIYFSELLQDPFDIKLSSKSQEEADRLNRFIDTMLALMVDMLKNENLSKMANNETNQKINTRSVQALDSVKELQDYLNRSL